MIDPSDPRINYAPADFDPRRDLPAGFAEFLLPLHRAFTPRQQQLAAERRRVLHASQAGRPPDYRPPSAATQSDWQITLPQWCLDQRNQMTGPADDAELTVKLLNSGSPGVMLDVEDSMANYWPNLVLGISNIDAALRGRLTYNDAKRQATVGIRDPHSPTAIWLRPRGLHLNQGGVVPGELISASLFDTALITFNADHSALKHPLAFYIPKSESAEEALWWRDLFRELARLKGWPGDTIKCMALVEAFPLAYQMEEFLYNLRDHILGLNLGRWDFMASLMDYNLEDPLWVLPDRNTIPFDVPFFQNLRELMPEICHRHGAMAIGGMTALYPSREDPELNARALAVLEKDKKNEANCLMDGAWTGHPDQNAIAVAQFPAPNQVHARRPGAPTHPNLRVPPLGTGRTTVAGTLAAVRTVIRYRNGVLNARGASLLDGYMEDLATDRIYRVMIAQRLLHHDRINVTGENGEPVDHNRDFITQVFDQELGRLLRELPADADESASARYRQARQLSEQMIFNRQFDPA